MPKYYENKHYIDDRFWTDIFIGSINKVIDKEEFQSIGENETIIKYSTRTIDLKFNKVENPNLPKNSLELICKKLYENEKYYEFGIAVSPQLEFWEIKKFSNDKSKKRRYSKISDSKDAYIPKLHQIMVSIAYFLTTNEIMTSSLTRLEFEDDVYKTYDQAQIRLILNRKELFINQIHEEKEKGLKRNGEIITEFELRNDIQISDYDFDILMDIEDKTDLMERLETIKSESLSTK